MKRIFVSKILVLLIISSIYTNGQNINMNELIKDTQRSIQTEKEMTIFWWLPTIFWETSWRASKSISEEEIENSIKIINDYTIFEVIDGDFGLMGAVHHSSEKHIRENFYLEIGDEKIAPLSKSDVSADLNNFLDMMKPMMANAMGEMGKGMKFIVFNNKNDDGDYILDPVSNNIFKAVLEDKEFTWRLPLGSVLPSKYDPETNEKFPGNYNFNPFSGVKLITK